LLRKQIPEKYLAVFANRDKESHIKLKKALKKYIEGKEQ